MLVRVKGKGVKLAGKWYFKGEKAEVEKEEYEKNKEYVDIIIGDVEDDKLPQVPSNPAQDEEEKELTELREKAKKLGVRNAHLMKKENLEKAIAEIQAPMFGTKPKEAENNQENDDTNVEDNAEIEENTTEQL